MTLGNWIGALEKQARRRWNEVPSWWNVLVAWPFVLAIALLVHQSNVYRSIAQRQKTAACQLISQDAANHNCFRYSFSVNGITFGGCGTPANPNAQTGQQVLVYFDPEDPNQNSLSSFEEMSSFELGAAWVPTMFALALVLTIFWRRRRANRTHERTGNI